MGRLLSLSFRTPKDFELPSRDLEFMKRPITPGGGG